MRQKISLGMRRLESYILGEAKNHSMGNSIFFNK